MPKLTDQNLETVVLNNNFKYSYTPVGDLGSTEYTLINLLVDTSGSTRPFIDIINQCIDAVIKGCKSPNHGRADNFLLRIVSFDDQVKEILGFTPVININEGSVVLTAGGTTNLYEAAEMSVQALTDYANVQLGPNEFISNGVLYVITDGLDNHGRGTPQRIAHLIEKAVTSEHLDSLLSILVGVGISDPMVKSELDKLKTEAKFDAFIDIGDANPTNLAKLAGIIVSQSLSQSQSLGTAQPSQVVDLNTYDVS